MFSIYTKITVMELSMQFCCVSYLQLVSRGTVKIACLKTGFFFYPYWSVVLSVWQILLVLYYGEQKGLWRCGRHSVHCGGLSWKHLTSIFILFQINIPVGFFSPLFFSCNMVLLMWSWIFVKAVWEDLQNGESNDLPGDTWISHGHSSLCPSFLLKLLRSFMLRIFFPVHSSWNSV